MFTQNWSAPQLARSVPHSSISTERPARWGISISSQTGKLRPELLQNGVSRLTWCGSNCTLSTNTEAEVQVDSRLPRQRVHFPVCLATQYGLVVEFWPTGCKQK